MVHVITKIERPSRDLIDRFRGIGTATIHEASGRKGTWIVRSSPSQKGSVSVALPLRFNAIRRDNLMLHKALERAQPGDILVASVGGLLRSGLLGRLDGDIGDGEENRGIGHRRLRARLRRNDQNGISPSSAGDSASWGQEKQDWDSSTTQPSSAGSWSILGI